MGTRLELHAELLQFLPNVYFRQPSNINMQYPCIVYTKTGAFKNSANNGSYRRIFEYQLTVIEHDPDGTVADRIDEHFDYASLGQYFVVDNLNHTTLTLYY